MPGDAPQQPNTMTSTDTKPSGSDLNTLPRLRAADTLPAAMLLSLAGGSIDAFTFLYHGHIFAGVMTGNAVMLGASVLQLRWIGALHYLGPMAAFFAGLFVCRLLEDITRRHAVTVGLLTQIAGLTVASFLPASVPNSTFVSLVAFVTAFQVASFRKAGEFSYSSTFITSDFRTAADGLFEALDPAKRASGLLKSRDLALVLLSFFTGATISAFLGRRFFNHSLWFAAAVLCVIFIIVLRAAVLHKPSLNPSKTHPQS
jgi:uncharacterized membrane protein YoaK (UPF0700 family)